MISREEFMKRYLRKLFGNKDVELDEKTKTMLEQEYNSVKFRTVALDMVLVDRQQFEEMPLFQRMNGLSERISGEMFKHW